MVRPIFSALIAATVTLINAVPAVGNVNNLAERDITNPDGASSSKTSVSRDIHKAVMMTPRNTTEDVDFFPSDSYEALCKPGNDTGSTSDTSAYVEDCSYILSYVRTHWGFWNLNQLVAGQDYPLIQHNTCSLYYRVPEGRNSLQMSNADAAQFVNTTINKYKQTFGNNTFSRVEATGDVDCFATDGVTEVTGILSLKR